MGKIRNALLGGLTALLIGVMPVKAESLANSVFWNKYNPFIQPNDSTLVYYGSGDVNKDKVVDVQDLNLIKQGTYNDMSDINGDGKQTNEDITILDNFINKRIPYLPSQWNKLQTREERIDWNDKMFVIDKTNEIPYVTGKWICDDYSNQIFINFSGFSDTNFNHSNYKYNLNNNGRFNLAIYYVSIFNYNFSHAIDGILVGDNPLDFNDWYFIEPQSDKNVNPGYVWFPKDSNVEIRYINPSPEQNYVSFNSMVKFQLINGQPNLTYSNDFLVLTRPTPNSVAEETPRQFSLSQNYPNPFNSSTTIEYNLKEPGNVRIEVFNITGQKLETLVNGNQTAGSHRINWNANKYSSGTYLYRLKAGKTEETKRMMIVK